MEEIINAERIFENFNNGIVVLRQFYIRNRESLLPHLIGEVPPEVLRHIAVMLHDVALFPSQWKEFAYLMGIQNNFEIARIAAAAEAARELPLYIAMYAILNSKSFVHIINTLLTLERDDILRYLEPYTKRLLNMQSED